jgi:5-methyltetrahydropteroyltriglutamate--homocysteine methyltransferase
LVAHYQETPEDVAERIRVCLEHVPADKLYLNPDWGFRRVARWIATRKLESMVQGTAMVRKEIGG